MDYDFPFSWECVAAAQGAIGQTHNQIAAKSPKENDMM